MSKWISVKKYLPYSSGNSHADCIMWHDAGNDSGIMLVGFYDHTAKMFVADYSRIDNNSLVITHWMPLPEPPEAE